MKYTCLMLMSLFYGINLYAQEIVNPQNNTSQTSADQNFYPASWQFDCSISANQNIKFEFVSKSGDATEDDMEVFVTPLNAQRVKLSLPRKLYTGYGILAAKNLKTNCGEVSWEMNKSPKIGAILIRQDLLLLFISVDDRPSVHRWTMLVMDTKTGKVFDSFKHSVAVRFGHSRSAVVVRKYRDGFQMRAVKEFAGLPCDCIEDYIEDWLNIRVDDKGKIHTTWHSPPTPGLKKMPKP